MAANPSIPSIGMSPAAGSSLRKAQYHMARTCAADFHARGARRIGVSIWFQAYQIYVMRWPRPQANGMLGLWYPWLIKSETLHYGYALVMLIGIWVFRKGFTGRAHTWWMVAFWIQFWHHIEHFLLIYQATTHHNFWHKPVPCSVLQLFFPRVELHLFYNTIVFIPDGDRHVLSHVPAGG